MGQRHSVVYFTVYLLFFATLADLTETISLVCNKGILVMNNGRETVFTVIQENCPVQWGTCEDCYDFCSNYTDVIFRIKDVDVSGPFNMSWTTINGEDSTYLMQYGLQQYNGILLIYYAVLHLPAAKIPSKGIYSIVMQCQTSALARIRVTIWLPAGNRTSYVNYPPSSVKNTIRFPYITKDANVHTIKGTTDSHQTNKELSAGTMVAVILGIVVAFTVFIVISVAYMRRAAKNRHHALDSSLQQASNNQYCKTNQEVPSVTSKSVLDQAPGISDPRDADDPWGKQVDHMDECPTSPSSQVLHDIACDQNRSHTSAFEKVNSSSDYLCRHNFRGRETMHEAKTVNLTGVTNVRRKQLKYPVEQNSSFGYIVEDQFPSDIQEQLKSLNLDAEMP